ncbi:hypothetical protein HER32_11875 [Hymenobacter sp. BT18]|uniref:hypothetical protein n=1 Tax=Hymenobacter sp. BT18 TaxID=2835648 RepID=UPI00143EBFCA|nr:hypothetical protein [Hymenobacter sp. BT18]QIX61840.1 hypothetical protein HER32_11875 [Hymenobacter sp. BT18]
MCTDEEYSPELKKWVAKQLHQADKKTFLQLLNYFQTRGGPGLVLAQEEAEYRNLQPHSLTPSLRP